MQGGLHKTVIPEIRFPGNLIIKDSLNKLPYALVRYPCTVLTFGLVFEQVE